MIPSDNMNLNDMAVYQDDAIPPDASSEKKLGPGTYSLLSPEHIDPMEGVEQGPTISELRLPKDLALEA